MELHAGQSWTYRSPQGYEASRLVIGAVASFDHHRAVVLAAVTGAPRRHADGHLEAVTIPFIPMTEEAFRASVVECEGIGELPEAFFLKLEEWQNDPRGLSTFTVPFTGFLDQMIANQMAEIAGRSAA